MCVAGGEGEREWEGARGRSVACAENCAMHFSCRDKDCEKHTEKRARLLTAKAFLMRIEWGREREKSEREREASPSVGRATKWI